MTITPLARAFWIAGTMALESLAVIMIVFAPAVIMFSMAVTCAALSPSCLPAAVSSFAPLDLAMSVAPSFIFTKNGLVSVLVMRPITGWSAATASVARVAAPATATTANRDEASLRCMVVSDALDGRRGFGGVVCV